MELSKDKIIRMAREAGFPTLTEYGYESLQRFAALVAAYEREACAKVCDELKAMYQKAGWDNRESGASQCAATIRARNQK